MREMTYHTYTALLMLLLASPVLSAAESLMNREFIATYDVYRSGLKVAKMERRVVRQADGSLQLSSDTRVTGLASLFRDDQIVETSIWKFDTGRIIPQYYEYRHTGSKKQRNVTIEFDWENHQITNSVNGSSWKMPAQEGMLDKLVYQYSIMLDLKAGKSDLSYRVADGGLEKVYEFRQVGEEIVETPLGKLQTVKHSRHFAEGDRQSVFWSAPELDYLPVKLENTDDGEKTVVLINSLTTSGDGPAVTSTNPDY